MTWTFATPFAVTPVVVGMPVDLNTGNQENVNVDIESVSPTAVTVRVWRTQSILALLSFPTAPVGAGTPVHLMAMVPTP